MAKSITIRGVPDETVEQLASRAAASGRSLQEYLKAHLVDLATGPDVESLIAAMRARKVTTGSRASIDVILGHRDADRR